MITQNQFPLGNPTQIAKTTDGFSRLTYIIIFSAIMIGGLLYCLHYTNRQNENEKK